MRGEWRFYSAGEIIFGRDSVRRAGETLLGLGAARACLITDPGLVAAGLHEPVLASLQGAGVEADLHDGGRPKPTLEAVAASAAALQGGDYDALVALGGGSNIDLAKAVAVLLRHGGEVEDYFGEHMVP